MVCGEPIAELATGAMQMGANGAEGHPQGEGDAFVGLLFLMIEDEYGALGRAEGLEVLLDGVLQFTGGELLLGVGSRAGEPVVPAGFGVGEGGEGLVVAAAAFPLILGDVDGDAIEVGGEQGVSAEVGKGAEETKKDLLGEILQVLPAAGEAKQGAEDHVLVCADQVLEGGVRGQAEG